ncbi:OmpA family protein [Flavobacteriales bacterium]|nr:OmpA family protein [Flavobacteriales bacterium]
MKTLFTFFFLFIFSIVFSQKMASFTVVVTDYKNAPLKGEQILMVGKSSKQVFKGVTSSSGTFDIDIPGGDVYDIKIKSVGDAKDYNTMEIPAIGENQSYNKGTLTIMIEQPKSFTLDNVHFDSGNSSIKPSSYDELKELVAFLKLKPEIKIEVGGHTDNVGEKDANQLLSQNRANSVMKYLIDHGVSELRLTATGYGENSPVADNSTDKGRRLNRRTEVRVL